MRPYSSYKESGFDWLGQIPDHWEVNWLKNLFYFEKGTDAQKFTVDFVAGNPGRYPVYSGQTENEGVLGYINSFCYDTLPVIFVTTVGARAMSTKLISGKFSLSQNCAMVIPNIKEMDIRYFHYFLMSAFLYEKGKISLIMQPSLRFSDLAQYKVLFPPLAEQLVIADYLDRKTAQIDTLIAKKQKQIDLLQEQRTAIITQAVTKGLNPSVPMKDSGFDWLGEIPAHWNQKRIKYIAPRRVEQVKNDDERGLLLSLDSIESKTGRLIGNGTFEGQGNKFAKGDILFCKLRPYLCKVIIAPQEGVAVSDLLVLNPSPEVEKRYLFYRMLESNFISVVDGSTYGAKMPRASWDFIGNLITPLPPFSEQRAIADFLDRKTDQIDNLSFEMQRSIDLLLEYRTSLISAVVTGKIDVRGGAQ